MLISFQKNFIFIHVYKVAGTSIRNALEEWSYNPEKHIYNRIINKVAKKISLQKGNKPIILDPKGVYPLLEFKNIHIKANEILKTHPTLLDKNYVFAFVRNPWDWQVSLYSYMKKNKRHKQHEFIKNIKTFKDYIYWRVENEVCYQSDFFVNKEGRILVNYVGRLETIEEDFNFLCNQLNINATLPKVNTSKHKRYTEMYDEETQQLIEKNFEKDIKLLGYSFDSYDPRPVREIIEENINHYN